MNTPEVSGRMRKAYAYFDPKIRRMRMQTYAYFQIWRNTTLHAHTTMRVHKPVHCAVPGHAPGLGQLTVR